MRIGWELVAASQHCFLMNTQHLQVSGKKCFAQIVLISALSPPVLSLCYFRTCPSNIADCLWCYLDLFNTDKYQLLQVICKISQNLVFIIHHVHEVEFVSLFAGLRVKLKGDFQQCLGDLTMVGYEQGKHLNPYTISSLPTYQPLSIQHLNFVFSCLEKYIVSWQGTGLS